GDVGSDVAARSRGQARNALADRFRGGKGRKRRAGADLQAGPFRRDAGQPVDSVQADHARRLSDVFFLQVVQVGSPRQKLAGAPARIQQSNGLIDGGGSVVLEVLHD